MKGLALLKLKDIAFFSSIDSYKGLRIEIKFYLIKYAFFIQNERDKLKAN
jgi:hypothetical protein